MSKNLGFLTAYGLEDVYDFIGEDKMKEKIQEYKNRPTFGYKLENFVGSYYDFTGGSEKGPLSVMSTLLSSWFKEEYNVALYIYEKSKEYNAENYLKNEPFMGMWEKYLLSIDRIIRGWTSDSVTSIEEWQEKKLNPYWIDYHFLIHEIVEILLKHNLDARFDSKLIEIFNEYFLRLDSLTFRMKQDKSFWGDDGLGSGILMHFEQFFEMKGEEEVAQQIRVKAGKLGWRPYSFDVGEENEDEEE